MNIQIGKQTAIVIGLAVALVGIVALAVASPETATHLIDVLASLVTS